MQSSKSPESICQFLEISQPFSWELRWKWANDISYWAWSREKSPFGVDRERDPYAPLCSSVRKKEKRHCESKTDTGDQSTESRLIWKSERRWRNHWAPRVSSSRGGTSGGSTQCWRTSSGTPLPASASPSSPSESTSSASKSTTSFTHPITTLTPIITDSRFQVRTLKSN